MEERKISVIVPVYNVADYVDTCLETLTNQTYENLEILLINDGSTDNSLEKLLEWEKRDERVSGTVFYVCQDRWTDLRRRICHAADAAERSGGEEALGYQ